MALVVRREVQADVAQPCRSEHRVHGRVQDHVGVGVPDQTGHSLEVDAAEPQRAAGVDPVDVESGPYAQGHSRVRECSARLLEVRRRRDLAVRRIPVDGRDLAAVLLQRRCLIGDGSTGSQGSFQGGAQPLGACALGCLRQSQILPLQRTLDPALRVALDRVVDVNDGNGRTVKPGGLHHGIHQRCRRQRPGRVVDQQERRRARGLETSHHGFGACRPPGRHALDARPLTTTPATAGRSARAATDRSSTVRPARS